VRQLVTETSLIVCQCTVPHTHYAVRSAVTATAVFLVFLRPGEFMWLSRLSSGLAATTMSNRATALTAANTYTNMTSSPTSSRSTSPPERSSCTCAVSFGRS